MNLTTLSRAKALAGISTTSDDTTLNRLIVEWSQKAETEMQRKVQIMKRTEYFTVRDTRYFHLDAWPIVSITSIKNDWERDWTNSAAVDTSCYTYESDNGVLILDTEQWAFDAGLNALQVIYTGGMAKTTESVADPSLAATAVNADADAYETALTVTSTTGLAADDYIIIADGTAYEETIQIESVDSATVLTLATPLAYAHTAVQAHAVQRVLRGFVDLYPEIAGAIDQQVITIWKNRDRLASTSVSNPNAGTISFSKPGAWLDNVLATLKDYRRKAVIA